MPASTTIRQNTPLAEHVEVTLTGFRSFADINQVRRAVSRIPGVWVVQARTGVPGAMALLVEYDGVVPFAIHLAELRRNRGHELPDQVELSAA